MKNLKDYEISKKGANKVEGTVIIVFVEGLGDKSYHIVKLWYDKSMHNIVFVG